MKNSPVKIAIVTNVIPSYREEFYETLVKEYETDLTIYCQTSIPGMSLLPVHDRFRQNVHLVKHLTARNEKVGWQFLPLNRLFSNEIIFIYGNPRVISNVIYSLLLRILNRKVVIWGQVHTAGSNHYLRKLRLLWWRCFRFLFVYTDHEKDWLIRNGFCHHLIQGMNNGLDQKKIDLARRKWDKQRLQKWQKKQKIGHIPLLLSCARLIPKNRFEECVALLRRMKDCGLNAVWALIGDGPERHYLDKLSSSLEVDNRILWLGAIYSEDELAPWFLSADVFIHPSAIGLSLLHAMGYGLPVVTNNDTRSHMPEFASFVEGKTGLSYEPGDIQDFYSKTVNLLADRDKRNSMSNAAENIVRSSYNIDVMVNRFKSMVTCTNDAFVERT